MMFGTHADITERKRAHDDIIESNWKLRRPPALTANEMAAQAQAANIGKARLLANMTATKSARP